MRAVAISCFLSLLFSAVGANAQLHLVGQFDPLTGNNRYGDVWGAGNYAYVGSFSGSGVAIFDISDPANATLVTQYGTGSGGRFKDVKVQNNVGYFASDNGGGVHLVDLTDPANPVMLSQIDSSISGYDSIHNVTISGNFLFEADSHTEVVKVFDVSNPLAPTFVRDIVTTDTRFIHDATAIGNRLYTSGWSGTTDIYDISGMSATQAPTLLGTISSGGNSHSNWANNAGTILVSAREIANGDVRIFDISDPTNPSLLASIDAASLGIDAHSPHNPVIMGDVLYVSWYQAGLQMFDISDPSNPLRIGAYDTFPGAVSGFDGNWGVYPFLGPDRILLSDLDGGLFIVSAVPEPSLVGILGLFALGGLIRRKRH